PINDTENFLFNLGEFSINNLTNMASKNGAAAIGSFTLLNAYYEQALAINQELQKLTMDIVENNKSWSQLERQASSVNASLNNPIASAIENIETISDQYPELSPFYNDTQLSEPQWFNSQEILPAEATTIFERFLNNQLNETVVYNSNVTNTRGEIPGYLVSLATNNGSITGQVSKKGGKVIWYLWEKQINQAVKIDIASLDEVAINFIKRKGFDEELKEVNREITEDYIEYNFVCTQNQVTCYPEFFWVRIARDDGKVIAYNGSQLLLNHQERIFDNPKLSEAAALKAVSSRLTETEVIGLAVVKNSRLIDVLTYEIIGRIGNNKYRIFINADNGIEEHLIREK
ncbi:MAG: germination protein YpeB, partial [Bacillota bacterium]|nr:germination protein YpeB [Bacillota bacterium]